MIMTSLKLKQKKTENKITNGERRTLTGKRNARVHIIISCGRAARRRRRRREGENLGRGHRRAARFSPHLLRRGVANCPFRYYFILFYFVFLLHQAMRVFKRVFCFFFRFFSYTGKGPSTHQGSLTIYIPHPTGRIGIRDTF